MRVFAVLLAACGGGGGTLITPPGVPTTCSGIADLAGCDHDAIGFSCTADRPDSGSAGLACSAGFAHTGSDITEYCCAKLGTALPACAQTQAEGCIDPAIAIACTGSAAPGPADELPCSAGQPGSGATIYCCTAGELPTQCATDATVVCVGFAIGYTCNGTATPADLDVELTCTETEIGSDDTASYCCASL